ncbi:MAG: hypothetical protein H6748_09050 [Spirochaetaceae bacterium]|nr:hypothetical protein [Myxococcales bacterium]MCB9724178.1 hypothetical protein [Spirochaetaceae bacterium]
MAIRFGNRPGRGLAPSAEASPGGGFGDWWAAVAVVALAAVSIVSLAGSTEPAARPDSADTPRLLEALAPATRALGEIESAFSTLCHEPLLVGLELEPDCETGVITLHDELFSTPGGAELSAEGREYVAAAVTTWLARLRRLPAIWESLEAIEIRGHSDPRAYRNPYTTNMVGSQQRALGVLLFLVGDEGVAEEDRETLEQLVMVSGASFSRPPETCPEESRECFGEWRRVEIRPVLSESLRRGDWARTVEDVRRTSLRLRQEASAR